MICLFVYSQWMFVASSIIRAGGIGLAAPVLAGPVFSQDESKIPFLQKTSINKVLV